MKPLFYLRFILIAVIAVGFVACESDSTSPSQTPVNEAEVLLNYLESNGDYINTSAPSIVAAADVRTTMLTSPSSQYIIDMRSSTDFVAGHIEGAKNVTMAGTLTHLKSLANASGYTRIVIVCYSGQTAAYATSLLRLSGFNNVYSMKWGMSSWDSTFAKTSWLTKIGNAKAAEFSTTAASKAAAGSLPTINTGKTTGAEILEARVNELLAAGYSAATVDVNTLFTNLSNYYIVNYWPVAQYNSPGHIPGS
ncbi:MAG TPA: rhodanese-like domain-containing protein, partial [Bacteroidota bacterium]